MTDESFFNNAPEGTTHIGLNGTYEKRVCNCIYIWSGKYWMPLHDIISNESPLLEKLADLEHEQWIHWTRYMLENLTEENIKRWGGLLNIPYGELTEEQKESDRVWARKVIAILEGLG